MIPARHFGISLLSILILCGPSFAADSSLLERQRQVFREVYAQAELGNWRPAASHEQLLKSYILWPYLRAAWLRTRVRNDDYAGVDEFLDRHGTLKPARELRYYYALALGQKAKHAAYLSVYQQFYQGLEIAKLDCLALQAELAAGRDMRIVNRGLEHWLIGRNQVDECDPVFSNLRGRGIIGEQQYRERFQLALDERQFSLARYLARSLPADFSASARRWTAVVNDPSGFLEQHDPSRNNEEYRQQLIYAAERIAFRYPQQAASLWQPVEAQYPFTEKQKNEISRHIALWAARRHEPDAAMLLASLGEAAVDVEVHRWRARTALKHRNWADLLAIIRAMPADERDAEEWRYWQAWGNKQSGYTDLAKQQFDSLANERSFYGFLSADIRGQAYSFEDERLIADEALIAEMQQRTDLRRARELFMVGLEGRGRSEWDAAVAYLSAHEKLQASILAHRWGWHSRAIATAAQIGEFDDLQLRFPLPYRETFEKHASAAKVRRSWAYGVARSESLFMRDIRSSAGAIGLMQLMPATGRRTASELGFPYAGYVTLVDPDSNIRLGTAYLRKMLQRFDENRVLATAAYNAGPANVEAWLPEEGTVDSLIWIENIPYNETRSYVRRVLATDTIFEWRLSGRWQRLSQQLKAIKAPVSPPQVADSK